MPEGRATTFSVENHEGLLYNVSPTDTKFFSMLGGLFGGEPVGTTVIPWQEHELRPPAIRARAEGADHPTPTHVVRSPVHNVLQIVQESIDTSWTKRATSAMLKAIGSAHPNIAATGEGNPVGDEHDWQFDQQLKEVARDVEHALLNGDFVEPADNNSARQTRGIIAATETNSFDEATGKVTDATATASTNLINSTAHGLSANDRIQFTRLVGGAGLEERRTFYVVGGDANTFSVANEPSGSAVAIDTDYTAVDYEEVADLADQRVQDLLQEVWDNNGIQEEEMALLMCNSFVKRRLTKLFITDANYQEQSRRIGGVAVTTIITDFGELNVVANRFIPRDTLQVVSLEQCKVCYLVLDDGVKVRVKEVDSGGARVRSIVYFEFGLRYGNELTHGNIRGLASKPAAA